MAIDDGDITEEVARQGRITAVIEAWYSARCTGVPIRTRRLGDHRNRGKQQCQEGKHEAQKEQADGYM